MKSLPYLLVSVIISSAILGPAIAQNITALNAAVKTYNMRNYKNAATQLEKIVQDSPGSVEAHYYLANCYYQLKQFSAAVKEYHLCQQLAPQSQYSSYAEQALKALTGRVTKGPSDLSPTGNNVTSTPSSTMPTTPAAAAATAPAKPAASATPARTSSSDAALARMQAEAAESQNAHSRMYDRLAGRVSEQTERKIKQLKVEEEDRVNGVQKIMPSGLVNQDYDAQVKAVKDEIASRIEALKKEDEKAKAKYGEDANKSGQKYDTLIDDLKSQMDSGRGVKLKPQGSNIYIRNYGQ